LRIEVAEGSLQGSVCSCEFGVWSCQFEVFSWWFRVACLQREEERGMREARTGRMGGCASGKKCPLIRSRRTFGCAQGVPVQLS
jgi:hypothetical protein